MNKFGKAGIKLQFQFLSYKCEFLTLIRSIDCYWLDPKYFKDNTPQLITSCFRGTIWEMIYDFLKGEEHISVMK